MSAILIYADTTVWNALCDQSVDAERFTKDLATLGAQLVLGTNAVYEMAKTFKGSRLTARQRGRELFSYLKQYVQLDIPLLRQTDDLLREEAKHVAKDIKDLDLFYGSADYEKLVWIRCLKYVALDGLNFSPSARQTDFQSPESQPSIFTSVKSSVNSEKPEESSFPHTQETPERIM